MATALIADIRRLTLHDGPGVRTTVFVKGCPLRCIWCHNPESIDREKELIFHSKLCIRCGKCAEVCPNGVHTFSGTEHRIDRRKCRACGKCAEACLVEALTLCGREMSAEEVCRQVLRDRLFFTDGGGVTVSGGEPLLFPEFTAELFSLLKKENIHTALDTCGAVSFDRFEKVLPFTDMVLFDLKGMDEERHKANTGCGNALIHENLRKLGGYGIPIEIRMPIVPGCNDFPEDIRRTAELLAEIPSVQKVKPLAYHDMARSKYAAIGKADTMPHTSAPTEEFLKSLAEKLK